MGRLVKVGDVIYENGKTVVAQFTKGSWYKKIRGKVGEEFEVVDPEKGQVYSSMPNTLDMPMSDGELAILDEFRKGLSQIKKPELTVTQRKELESVVRDGVMLGLRRYGPYEPDTDARDLQLKILKEARNLIVYLAMYSIQQNRLGMNTFYLQSSIQRAIRTLLEVM